jgi:hypothetical protein
MAGDLDDAAAAVAAVVGVSAETADPISLTQPFAVSVQDGEFGGDDASGLVARGTVWRRGPPGLVADGL